MSAPRNGMGSGSRMAPTYASPPTSAMRAVTTQSSWQVGERTLHDLICGLPPDQACSADFQRSSGNLWVLEAPWKYLRADSQSATVAGCRPVWPGWQPASQARLASRCATSLPFTFYEGRDTISFGPEGCLYKGRQLLEVTAS